MFKPREVPEFGQGGPTSGAAALTHAQLAVPLPGPSLLVRLAEADWAPDLADAIGSKRWFRGLATMLGLTLAACAFWPDSKAMAAMPSMPVDSAEREEFRAQMIQPLAYGADSGRRMGATAAVVAAAGPAAPPRSSLQLTATLGQGDSFERMLARAGVSGRDAAATAQMIARVIPLDQIAPGTQVDLTLGNLAGSERPLERLTLRARFDLDVSVSRLGGALQLQQHAIAVDTTPLRIRGKIGRAHV